MASRCLSTCRALFVLLSLLTHLAELALSALLAYALYRDDTHRHVFFALTAGLLIIPLVTLQLLSALFLLRRRGDSMTGREVALMAVLHVLQLGFVWRHLAVLRERDPHLKRSDLSELFVLRLTFTFAAGFPLLLIQLYLLVTGAELTWSSTATATASSSSPSSSSSTWVAYAALVASVLSTTWAVASFRRPLEALGADCLVPAWPASLFRLLWRGGEIVARVISLTLFASLYRHWLFLVLGGHWLVTLCCLSLPQLASAGQWQGTPLAQRVAFCVLTSYSYVFCYVDFWSARSAVWYALYYVIMFLENATLSIVWLTKSQADGFTSRCVPTVLTIQFCLVLCTLCVPMGIFSRGKFGSLSPKESQLQRSRATQP